MVNVLVIGALGYVGAPLSVLLRKRGHTVYGLVRNVEKAKELVKAEVYVVVGDGTKAETLVEVVKKVDVIINTTVDFTNINVDQQSLDAIEIAIEKAGGNKKRVIFVSGFFDLDPSNDTLTEESATLSEATKKKLAAVNPVLVTYVSNRIEALKKIQAPKNFSAIIVRGAMLYGGLKGHWTIHFKNAEEGKLVVYGGGTAVGFLHVDDFVDGIVKVTEAEPSKVDNQVFHFVEAEAGRISQKEVAEALARGAGKDPKELKEETAPFPLPILGSLWGSSLKAKRVLGWTPHHNLARDAKLLFDAWKANDIPATW
jgi:nucleoside-diphosphate-sugar epimerase